MNIVGWLLRILITLIGCTLRWRIEDAPGLLAHPYSQPMVFAFWHNRIFLMPYLFRKHWRTRQRTQTAVLVSASADGEKLVRVLSRFDLLCVRGSTSRRGQQALMKLTRLMQDGYDVGITPDGPRGPKYRVQDGVISLAQLAQAPIQPVSYSVAWNFTFRRAWDNFMVPLPFARAVLRIGHPVTVPRDADAALRENKRLELERILTTLSES